MSKKLDRRNFIKKAALGLVSLEAAYLLYDTMQNKYNIPNNTLVNIGKITNFDKGRMYPFNSGHFFLSIMEDGGMLAISIKCTHLGCMVQKSKNGFECPCHSSSFNKYGEVLSPPATRALDIFPITIEQDEIFIDINKPIKRKVFDKSQLTYA